MTARSEYHQLFAATIKAIRLRTARSQASIAYRAGCSTKSIADYETGQKAPGTRDRLERLCAAIEATEDEKTALIDVWSMIQTSNQRNLSTAERRKPGPKPGTQRSHEPILIPLPVEPELRALQDRIDQIRNARHDDAPVIVCGVLNAVQRIAEQADTWQQRIGGTA